MRFLCSSGKGSGEGLRWLVSVNVNTCGAKDNDICRESTVVMLAVSLFNGEICVCLQSRSVLTMIASTM